MLTTEDILNMNFYKKSAFTGSMEGMRYLLKMVKEEDSSHFIAYIWPGPYNFATTDDSLKVSTTFPFTEDGKKEMVDWLNEQWKAREKEWPKR